MVSDRLFAMMSFVDILMGLLIAILWGVSFVVIKEGLVEIPPFLFASLRFLFSAIPFIFIFPRPKVSAKIIVGTGLGFTIQFIGLYVGIQLGCPAGLASLLIQSQVLFTTILAAFWFKEHVSPQQWIGILVASFGLILIAFLQNHSARIQTQSNTFQGLGILFILMGAFGWTLATFFIKKAKGENPLHLLVWASLVPIFPLLGLSYLYEHGTWNHLWQHLTIQGISSLFYIAYLVNVLGYTLWGLLLRRYPASMVAPFSMLIPIFGMSSAYLFLHETLHPKIGIAALLIFLGVALVILKKGIFKK